MFMRSQTQWRMGFSGPTGLDYNAVEILLRRFPVSNETEVFEGLQLMEGAALKAMA